MEDHKLKNLLKNSFDDFEELPNEDVFEKINQKLIKHYLNETANKRRKYYLASGLILCFMAASFFINYNSEKSIENPKLTFVTKNENNKELISKLKLSSKNEAIALAQIDESKEFKTLNVNNVNKLTPQNYSRKYLFSKSQSEKKPKINLQSEPTQNLQSEPKFVFVKSNRKFFTKSENATNQNENISFETGSFSTSNPENIGENNFDFQAAKPKFDILKGILKNTVASNFNLVTIKTKVPKKELPKINKNTPLAMEFAINPFYGFQKISATELGMANIQNISKTKLTNLLRMGYAAHINYVINWTKQSRLRIGLSYKDISQSVDYEKATDIFEFQTVNGNQTVLVRKGLPYSENKRNQMVGLKADRQFFLQLSTPTRFYASLGAEYTKSVNSSSQMLFVNSTMGLDMPLKNKWKLQIEPSYSYALLGTTDANKFVNINPNHLGVKVGLLYLIRE
jgi:hypothetical protein